jgi:hypothetical protein
MSCDSSGVYICKSVVNDLRHGNYICKSEIICLVVIGSSALGQRLREQSGPKNSGTCVCSSSQQEKRREEEEEEEGGVDKGVEPVTHLSRTETYRPEGITGTSKHLICIPKRKSIGCV